MKITLNNFEESEEEITTFEKFKSKRKKLAPGSQNVRKLTADENTDKTFNSSDLEELRGRGILDELISIIKSGKEASVYLGRCAEEYFAVKIYTDLRVRSFRKDGIYRQGRYIGEARAKKAIDQGSVFGIDAHQILWVQEEYRQMNFLYNKGIPVPKPVACSGLTVMMEFIGEDGIAADRLSDLSLEKDEAEDAFRQSLRILEAIVSSGRVHGDFSSYNILWHNGKAIAIDFPQVVGLNSNTAAKEILLKDVHSFCKSFKKHKIDSDAGKIYDRLVRMIDY